MRKALTVESTNSNRLDNGEDGDSKLFDDELLTVLRDPAKKLGLSLRPRNIGGWEASPQLRHVNGG